MWLLFGLLGGCRSEGGDPPSAPAGEDLVLVNRSILFSRQAGGISDGFDLDGAVTAAGGPTGCGIADYVSPTGTRGIDNAFATMLPALELTEAQAVEELVQATIASGGLLLMVELVGVDGEGDDPSVDVHVFRGTGAPLLGNDGLLLPNQTFDTDPTIPVASALDVPLVDGSLQADGLVLELPIQIFDVSLDLVLHDVSLRLARIPAGTTDSGEIIPEESWEGLMAGGVETSDIEAVAYSPNVDAALGPLVSALLSANADLAPGDGGACARLSMTFRTEAVPAFLYPSASSP